jgi:hypothetical protein
MINSLPQPGTTGLPHTDRFSLCALFGDRRRSGIATQRLFQPYCVRAGLPFEAQAFVQQLHANLRETAIEIDRAYPENAHLEIENGVPVLKRLKRKPDPEGRARLDQMIKDRLQPTGIMEVLVDTQHWLDWTRRFGPISGHDAKLDDPIGRYIATTFCYGYNFGPTQTARSGPPSAARLSEDGFHAPQANYAECRNTAMPSKFEKSHEHPRCLRATI